MRRESFDVAWDADRVEIRVGDRVESVGGDLGEGVVELIYSHTKTKLPNHLVRVRVGEAKNDWIESHAALWRKK